MGAGGNGLRPQRGQQDPKGRGSSSTGVANGTEIEEKGKGGEEGEGEEEQEEDSEAALEDYLANLGAGSGSEGEGSKGEEEGGEGAGGSAGRQRRQRQLRQRQYEVLRRFSTFDMGDEGPVGSRAWDSGGSSSEGLSESDLSGSSASSSELSGDETAEAGLEGGPGAASGGAGSVVLTQEQLAQLSLPLRYPVQARPQPPPLPGQQQQQGASGGWRKSKPGVKGAKGGKLAPGAGGACRGWGWCVVGRLWAICNAAVGKRARLLHPVFQCLLDGFLLLLKLNPAACRREGAAAEGEDRCQAGGAGGGARLRPRLRQQAAAGHGGGRAGHDGAGRAGG